MSVWDEKTGNPALIEYPTAVNDTLLGTTFSIITVTVTVRILDNTMYVTCIRNIISINNIVHILSQR